MPTESTSEHLVHLGMGSNLDAPLQQLRLGLQTIEGEIPLLDFRCAPFYISPPMAGMEQPDYLNTVCSFKTTLSPEVLLEALRAIEDQQGRQRKEHWGARTLDIDILLFGQMIRDDPDLTLPHPGMENRDFVLVPLLDLSPDLKDPRSGRFYRDSLDDLLKTSPLSLRLHHEGYRKNS